MTSFSPEEYLVEQMTSLIRQNNIFISSNYWSPRCRISCRALNPSFFITVLNPLGQYGDDNCIRVIYFMCVSVELHLLIIVATYSWRSLCSQCLSVCLYLSQGSASKIIWKGWEVWHFCFGCMLSVMQHLQWRLEIVVINVVPRPKDMGTQWLLRLFVDLFVTILIVCRYGPYPRCFLKLARWNYPYNVKMSFPSTMGNRKVSPNLLLGFNYNPGRKTAIFDFIGKEETTTFYWRAH